GFLALILAAGAAVWLQLRNQANTELVEHTLDVEARINQFASWNEQVETGRRGYMLSRQESFYDIYQDASARVLPILDDLTDITRDNPEQQERLARLRQLVVQQQERQDATVEIVRSGGSIESALLEDDRGVQLTREVRALARAMADEEAELLRQRGEEQRETLRGFYWVLGLVGVLLIGVAATTILVMLRHTRALAQSRAELRRLNEDLEGLVQERTADLQRANQEIQRFAYIVSHDLRSPLVNVMGFTAELDAARKTTSQYLERLRERD